MSYFTRVTGEITITPPIPWRALVGSPFLPDAARGDVDDSEYRDVMFKLVEFYGDTPEGTVTARAAVGIVPAYEDRYKAYDIEEHLQELVNRHGAGRVFSGRLEGEGEEATDLWRISIRRGAVQKEMPNIVWPDDDDVESR